MRSVMAAVARLTSSRERLRQALHDSSALPARATSPLHLAGRLANDALKSAVSPFAQRNPLGLVLGAAICGAVVAWTRPWRWLTPALLATLLPQLVSRAVAETPASAWTKVLANLTRPRHKADRSAR